jgi:hypothetical protein
MEANDSEQLEEDSKPICEICSKYLMDSFKWEETENSGFICSDCIDGRKQAPKISITWDRK